MRTLVGRRQCRFVRSFHIDHLAGVVGGGLYDGVFVGRVAKALITKMVCRYGV